MAKLNQVIALIPGKKNQAKTVLEEAYHLLQKPPLFDGLSRTYRPKEEDGDKLPSESKLPQIKAGDLIVKVNGALAEMFDIVATQDAANCQARASVSVDEKILLHNVPVTHLLFLEKQLVDLYTFVGKMPMPDPAELWQGNGQSDFLHTGSIETVRTKKVPKNHVKAEATKEHPAQVETYHEDIIAGYWSTIKYSGAMLPGQKTTILERIRKLQEAVKLAREEANSLKVEPVKEGEIILKYIFG